MRFVLAISHPPCARSVGICASIVLATTFADLCSATVLPVGPLGFSSNLDYDCNFKKPAAYSGIVRSANGYLELLGNPTGIAVYDTSVIPGVNGQGGMGGGDANNDLADFTISADVASSVPSVSVGFLLRLDNNEANGYLAQAQSVSPTAIQFTIFRGSGASSSGMPVFQTALPMTLAANAFYNFSVNASGGTFSLNFGHGAATASFTDAGATALSGQVGMVLNTPAPTIPMRLDNFAITSVPEPSTTAVLATSLAGLLCTACRRPKRR